MVEFAGEPVVNFNQAGGTVTLRIKDGLTDSVWRALFNELVNEETALDAEAMGSRSGGVDRTVLKIRLEKGTSSKQTVDALDAARRVAKGRTTVATIVETLMPRSHIGAAEWWRELGRTNPNETGS